MPKAQLTPEARASSRGLARSILRFPLELDAVATQGDVPDPPADDPVAGDGSGDGADEERAAVLNAARSVAELDFNPVGSAGRACAYLSGPATLTTAAHCLRDDAGAPMEPALFARVVARFFVRDASGAAVAAVLARPVPGSLRFEDGVDVARFDVTFVLGEAPPPLAFDEAALDEQVAVVTHGHTATLQVTSAFGRVRALEGRSVVHDCETHHGASGAPVFNSRWRVVATHSGGVSDGPPPLKEGVAPSAP